MGFSWMIYAAPPGAGPVHRWEADLFVPLGPVAAVRAEVDAVAPGLRWSETAAGLLGAGRGDPTFVLAPKPDAPGLVAWISVANASDAQVLALAGPGRSVFNPESCRPVRYDPSRGRFEQG